MTDRRRMERIAARRARAGGTTPQDVSAWVVDAVRGGRLDLELVRRARWLGSWAAKRALARLGLPHAGGSWKVPWDGMPKFRQGVRFGWTVLGSVPATRVTAFDGPAFRSLVEDFEAEGNAFYDDEPDEVAGWGVVRAAMRADLNDEECVAALDLLGRLRRDAPVGYVEALGGEGWWHHWEGTICSSLLRVPFGSPEKPWLVNAGHDVQSWWWPMEVAAYSEGKPFHRAAAKALQACLRELELGIRTVMQAHTKIHVGEASRLVDDVTVRPFDPLRALPGRPPVAFLRGGAGPEYDGASVTSGVQRGGQYGDWLHVWAESWCSEGEFLDAAGDRPVAIYEVDGTLAKDQP